MSTQTKATLADLYCVEGKAELVNGELVSMSPTGAKPNYAAGEIFASLRAYAQHTKSGIAVTDNAGFRVDLPHRQSFSPDAAYWTGESPGMKFFDGAPAFAAEVRSEDDYGPAAERAMAAKRADYFAAGTLVVWDMDLLGDAVVRVYRAADPENPTVYRRGDHADAEPAVPGWHMPVNDLFI